MRNMQCKLYLRLWLCLCLITTFSFSVLAQNAHVVKGVVLDESNLPIIGVNIFIKNSSIGTITDIDGNYSIQVPQNGILVYSYLGMETQEVSVKNRSQIDVVLKEDNKLLDEVIVIGYGTQRKKDLTTSVASVSSDEWEARPIISTQQALQGKAAGVQVVQPSGKPGVGISIRVRGATSLNAGNEPLYVVDGIPTNDINNLSANDIASIQVLKDASSAAIYGARGANGVVMITTKNGEEGSARIDVNMYAGFSNVTRQIKTLNTKDYFDLLDDIGISYDPTKKNYINWAKEMYGTGVQQNYQVSVSGGSAKTKYYISSVFQDENGIIKPASYDRFSLRTNLNTEVSSWLKLNTNLNFSRNTRMDATDNANSGRGGVIMSIINTPPNLPVWDPEKPSQYATNPYQSSWENPYAQADIYNRNRTYRFSGRMELDFTILNGLHFKPNLSVDYSNNTWDKFIDPIKTGYGRQANGRGEQAKDDYLTWTNENILSYNTSFNEEHNLQLLGGVTFSRYRHDNNYISVEDFVKEVDISRKTLNLANKINDARTSRNGNSSMSYLIRVQYDYLSRYLLSMNMRIDGSSKLYHKWKEFPSISAGWRFSDEAFFKNIKHVVNDAKLRFGWGMNGNEGGIGDYDLYDHYWVSRQKETGNGPAVGRGKLGNRDLKWETTSQYNGGLDFSFFNSRLTAEFDWYYKKTTNLLLDIKLPESAGVQLPLRNDGIMVNKGFEFTINGQVLVNTPVKWSASLNMSFNRNKIKELGLTPQFTAANIESNGEDVIMVRKGLALGTFYGYIAEGVNPETGNIIYKDLNGNGIGGVSEDGLMDPNDKTIIGNAQPDFIFGFTHNLSWKNFTLNAFFQGSYGNDIFNASRIDSEGMFDSKNQTETVLNRWKRPGMITDVPRAGVLTNSLNSTRFVEDGSYIRLKSLTLSYQFEDKLIRKIGVKKLNVYGTITNLFTLTKYRGYDPELSWTGSNAAQLGIDYGTYPQTRSFIFGLNLSF